jgi:WD40 repeat protein
MAGRQSIYGRLWMGWLLFVIVALLGGCIAPDGSIITLQQGADGSIVGWQLDAPSGSVATNAAISTTPVSTTSYPARPILYYGYAGNGEPDGIRGVYRDGTALDSVWVGYLFGWSPHGDRFAFMAYDSTSQSQRLVVATLDGEERTIFETDQGEFLTNLARQSLWSPDGSQIALVLQSEEDAAIRVAIIDVEGEEISGDFRLPLYSMNDPSTFSGLPSVRWSPDSQKLLLGFAELVVLDLASGSSMSLSDLSESMIFSDQSVWLPDSESVIYLDDYRYEDGILYPPQLWRDSFPEEDAELLLTTAQMIALGLEGSDQYSIHTSPLGTYLALVAINNGHDEGIPLESNILIFEAARLQREPSTGVATPRPVAQWTLPGMIFSVVWSPDEQELAYLKLSETEEVIEALSWSDGTTETVTVLTPPNDQGKNIFSGWNMVSWMP